MVFLMAAVVLVGLLCLLDLILTVGVIRRLREHTTLLGTMRSPMSQPDLGVPVGETVHEFTATTTGGDEVTREELSGRTLVGFFSPGCQPCSEQMPKFVERAGSMPGGTDRALAVVAGGADDGAEYTERLSPAARVVLEEPNGPVQAAFRVSGYPAFFLVDAGGVVSANAFAIDTLETAVPEPTGASA